MKHQKEDIVHDALLSACGACKSAPLSEVFTYLLYRQEWYFNQDGIPRQLTKCTDWKRLVRRILFTSPRFSVIRNTLDTDYEFRVITKVLPSRRKWYQYASTQEASEEEAARQSEREEHIELEKPQAHHMRSPVLRDMLRSFRVVQFSESSQGDTLRLSQDIVEPSFESLDNATYNFLASDANNKE